jgi:hypothetical protein
LFPPPLPLQPVRRFVFFRAKMPETSTHVAGLILARGGSIGIPLKNLVSQRSGHLLRLSVQRQAKSVGQ